MNLLHLIGNFTTNLAESWMHIRTKFDGGKQINRSQAGGWMGRCAGAGLRQNIGGDWGPKVWEKITGTKPNTVFDSVSKKRVSLIEKDRKRKSTEFSKQSRSSSKHRKTNDHSSAAQKDYSQHNSSQCVLDVANPQYPQLILEDVMYQYYSTYVKVTDDRIEEIERDTRGQGQFWSNAVWLAERKLRITSSIIGEVSKRRPNTKVCNLIKKVVYSTFRGNKATIWGTQNEGVSRSQYIAKSPHLSFSASGLVVSKSHPWLAASPDGLVYDPESDDHYGLVEFKNPYNCRNENLVDASHLKDCCLTADSMGLLHLKTKHNYYYQIQAAMFCTGRKWCDFVVRTNVDIHIERVEWNEQLWEGILPKLRDFYFTGLLPELAQPLYPSSGSIREPSNWLQDKDLLFQKFGLL